MIKIKLLVSAVALATYGVGTLAQTGVLEMSRTSDGREGIGAFVEKRRPVFTGV
jgi:1,4-dihydroxy-2-naphthoyl-CoA synthase